VEEGSGRITIRWEVDGSGSGSCPVADFGIISVEHSGYTAREFVNELVV
jgi:hypothetical protein